LNSFFIIILDGVGIGESPDADEYGDLGSNTLSNMANTLNGLNLPNLTKMGLGNIIPIKGIQTVKNPISSFGKMTEVSKGKDSVSGHWEIAGLNITEDFSYFPEGFPEELINKFLYLTHCKGILGNKPASGTEIIKEWGEKHQKTGYPIVYTSADSVFQIACHEETVPLNRLYEICEITRNQVLTQPLNVGRVIARPFLGKPGEYKRTTNRKDFSLDPPSETILDLLQKNYIPTIAIGKINDLFNYKGISVQEKTKSNMEGCQKLLEYAVKSKNSFVFTNLVDFDVYYGHRNDPIGFAEALKEFDNFLPKFLNKLHETDLLVITADHGNDPTSISTDHSREFVPLLFYQKGKQGISLGTRKTFSDVAKTVAQFFNVNNSFNGTSFLHEK
jgi:phosphopentomutase